MEKVVEKSATKNPISTIVHYGIMSAFFLAIGLFLFADLFAPTERYSFYSENYYVTQYRLQAGLASLFVGLSFFMGMATICLMLLYVQKAD